MRDAWASLIRRALNPLDDSFIRFAVDAGLGTALPSANFDGAFSATETGQDNGGRRGPATVPWMYKGRHGFWDVAVDRLKIS